MVFAIGLREVIFLNLLRVVTSGCADGSDGVDGAGNPIDTQTGLVWGALGAPTARRGEGPPLGFLAQQMMQMISRTLKF